MSFHKRITSRLENDNNLTIQNQNDEGVDHSKISEKIDKATEDMILLGLRAP
jgi:hypothetical protein